MTASRPTVSVVVSTYHRSRALCTAIESVLDQTLEDFELIVIGDHCTDDTEKVVAAFGDPRIRFENLAERCGDQSGPNTRGMSLARGEYVALLNHDDLWLPFHLQSSLDCLEAHPDHDLVFSLYSLVQPDGPPQLGATSPTGQYEPYVWAPASTWVFRRALFEQVGPWRHYRAGYLAPSQNWLRRAWQAGHRMAQHRRLSVVRFPSHIRPGCYGADEEDAAEQRAYLLRMRSEPDFLERELTSIAAGHAVGDAQLAGSSLMVVPHLRRALKNAVRACAVRLGIAPAALNAFMQSPRPGGAIDLNHRRRGIDTQSSTPTVRAKG